MVNAKRITKWECGQCGQRYFSHEMAEKCCTGDRMKIIRIIKLKQTCDACPTQWSGKLANGADVYVRYRWGCISFSVDGIVLFNDEIGGEYDGVCDWNDVVECARKCGYEIQTGD